MRTFTTGALCSLSLAVSLSMPAPVWSQERVGVATTVIGPVTVARASMPPAALKFKDDILLRDRVTTGDNAITRILLGGKVVVTARERSTLTITEVPGLSTIDLTSGRIAVAVDKTRMKPGERVEIRTPNAIAGVRGTVLIVEAEPDVSTVTVLRGLVDVSRRDPRAQIAGGAVTPVAKHETVTVRNNVLPARAQKISPARAEALSQEFTPPMRQVSASVVMPVEEEVERAKALLSALLPAEGQEADRSIATASGSMNTSSNLVTGTTTLLSTTTTTTLATGTTTLLSSTTSTTTNLLRSTTDTLLQSSTGGLLQPVGDLLK
ncbi:MAG TPA: FecR family protein [Methylomirabilota bacterium]|nr:FecR family protein [Methylomirabilota bacterium]